VLAGNPERPHPAELLGLIELTDIEIVVHR
jgi:hypothetical protein